jgi:hypothetical protein
MFKSNRFFTTSSNNKFRNPHDIFEEFFGTKNIFDLFNGNIIQEI